MSQFIEMFEGDKYPHINLEEISIDWLKGQSFKKNEMNDDGNNLCIHYGELFTKYGPIIKNVISRTNTEPKRVSKAGDILFPASDVTPNGLARCSMLNEDNVILGGDIIVLRPKGTYNPGYLSYAINQQTSQLLQRVNGGVVKHMSAKALKTVHIPMPPRDKQDEYIAVARQADKSEFGDIKSQFIEMFGDNYVGWKWPVKDLGKLYPVGTGGTPDRKNSNYYGGNIPWVKSTEVNYCELYNTEEHITEQALQESNCSIYPSGTILLAMYGQGTTRGRTAILKTSAAVNQAIAAIRVNDEIESVFLYNLLKVCYDYIRNLAVGGNQHNLNLKLVSSIPIVRPPMDLQQTGR